MDTYDQQKHDKADGVGSVALDFLAGRAPNPIPANKQEKAGPLTTQFIRETMDDVAKQDRANQRKAVPRVLDDLMAAMRLISDNRELIGLIESGTFASVSDLAAAMGRELPNVSRTLSRMAAYGLVGYQEGNGGDARAKKPVWLAPAFSTQDDGDWVQAYCFAMALKGKSAMGDADYPTMARVVRDAVDAIAEKINMIRSPASTR